MGMNEEELLDLIEKDLAGNLSHDERARLRAHLEADPDARSLHRHMVETGEVLGRVEDVDVPEGLKQRIMDAIDARRYPEAGRMRQRPPLWRRIFGPRLRLAYAFAVGVLAGIIVYSQMFDGVRTPGPSDVQYLYGIMAEHDTGDLREAGVAAVDLPGVSGEIRMLRAAGLVVVEQELSSDGPLETTLAFDAAVMRFEGFGTPAAPDLRAVSGEGWIKVEGVTRLAYVMTVLRPRELPAELRVEVGIPGGQVYRAEFYVTGQDEF